MKLPDALGEMAALLSVAASSLQNLARSQPMDGKAAGLDDMLSEITLIANRLKQISERLRS